MSKTVFDQVKHAREYPCVTITLETHRTAPDNKRDPIVLKNLLTQAEERLLAEFNKREIGDVIEKMKKLADSIDHSHNKEGLILFVNKDMALYDRLPFALKEEVTIHDTFATRDLIRNMHASETYYVLAISKQKARLFEGHCDKAYEITAKPFPMDNQIYTTDRLNRSMGAKEDSRLREFFNRVDKNFLEIYKEEPGELVLMGVEANVADYQSVADEAKLVIGAIHRNGDAAKDHEVASAAWPVVSEVLRQRRQEAIALLEKAVSEQKFSSDLKEIWRMTNQGRCEALYVEKGFFQPAIIHDHETIELTEDASAPGVCEDIVDEVIEIALQMKARVVFVDNGSLDKFQRMAMINRY
jgi:hypothetical protein